MFSDIFGKTSLELLSNYTTPEEILQVDTDKLIDLLSEASRGRLNKEKAESLKVAAKDSFGALLILIVLPLC